MSYIEITSERLDEMRQRNQAESVVMINLLKFRDCVEPGHGLDDVSGRDGYVVHYATPLQDIFARLDAGNEVLFANPALAAVIAPQGETWDMVAIVRFRSRAKFLEAMDDPQYADLVKIRDASLVDSRLVDSVDVRPEGYPTTVASDMPDRTSISPTVEGVFAEVVARPGDEPVVMLNLLRCRPMALPGAGVDGLDGGAGYDAYVDGLEASPVGAAAGLEVLLRTHPVATVVGPADEIWDLALMIGYPTRRHFTEMATSEAYRPHGTVRSSSVSDSRLIETVSMTR